MNRTIRAVLHYTAEDLKWVLVVTLILGLFGEGLGLAATLLDEPEDAGKWSWERCWPSPFSSA